MPRKIRQTARALSAATAGLLLLGTVGVATATAVAGRPAADAAAPSLQAAHQARLRHSVAMPFFSFRRH